MPEELKAYIAGFLDGDGCLMAQLVKRNGYTYGYQIRLSVVFYQHVLNIKHLEWVKTILKKGYIRKRNDQMAEYTIVGIKDVTTIIKIVYPYLRLKRQQARLLLRFTKLPSKPTKYQFLKFCRLVDETAKYNYSKKRKIFTSQVIKYLANK